MPTEIAADRVKALVGKWQRFSVFYTKFERGIQSSCQIDHRDREVDADNVRPSGSCRCSEIAWTGRDIKQAVARLEIERDEQYINRLTR